MVNIKEQTLKTKVPVLTLDLKPFTMVCLFLIPENIFRIIAIFGHDSHTKIAASIICNILDVLDDSSHWSITVYQICITKINSTAVLFHVSSGALSSGVKIIHSLF